MMNLKRVWCVMLAVLLTVALIPMAAIADSVSYGLRERRLLGYLDTAWAALETAEAQALAAGADKQAVIDAVYNAALANELVDDNSFSDFSKEGFFFRVEGMYCAYDYKTRNELDTNVEPVTEGKVVIKGNGAKDAESSDVLLIGPYYGHDGSFTDHYRNEATALVDVTGGDLTVLQSSGATGPAIVEAFTDKGVVLVDSHGTASGTSTYICLTTSEGITTEDYTNGWAVRSGSAAFIDGRYIQNHIEYPAANAFVWMGICEGMKASGNGTTGYALLDAGCGAVLGFSQSVTFSGDREYLSTFLAALEESETVADAFDIMTAEHGNPDPYGDAYPIVMSDVDPFPSNPDAIQTVNSEWILFGDTEPVALTSFSLATEAVEVYATQETTVTFVREPENANVYELNWASGDTSIATVAGNNRRVTITGVSAGTVEISCNVMVDGNLFGTGTIDVTVIPFPTLDESANIEGGNLQFTSTTHPWTGNVSEPGRLIAASGNYGVDGSSSTLSLVLDMEAEDRLEFEWKVNSESNYDFLKFYVNGTQVGTSISGATSWETVTYTAATADTYTFTWTYSKDGSVNFGDDRGYVDNVEWVRAGAPILMGDVDGNNIVTASDALAIMRHVLGLELLSEDQLRVADMNWNGSIDTEDVLTVLRIALMGN